ncbi:hypothetical protein TNCV_1968401 [Trichonephila clavipes]|nr:hypothetical protein TNCV_1968401 [Trichonephila clavipes]
METTNKQRTWDRKPHLVVENRDSISLQEDDEPDEGSGQSNVVIGSAVVGLKKPARMQISYSSAEKKSGVQVVVEERCIKCEG